MKTQFKFSDGIVGVNIELSTQELQVLVDTMQEMNALCIPDGSLLREKFGSIDSMTEEDMWYARAEILQDVLTTNPKGTIIFMNNLDNISKFIGIISNYMLPTGEVKERLFNSKYNK